MGTLPRDFVLFNMLCFYRILYLFVAYVKANTFKKQRYMRTQDWTKFSIMMLLILIIIGYDQTLFRQVNSVQTMNDNWQVATLRVFVALAICATSTIANFYVCGYRASYQCDEQNCGDCLMMGEHPETWSVTCLEYQLMCNLLYFPMAYVMAWTQTWIDTTDFGGIFLGHSSLISDAEDIKFTIDEMIADINHTLKESSEFLTKYETDLHSFAVEVQVKLRTDKIMLERLLKLRERHGNQFPKTRDFDEICDEHLRNTTAPVQQVNIFESQSAECELLEKNATHCENCTSPVYDDTNLIYTCTKGYAFDIAQKSRQVRCDFTDNRLKLVYEGNGTSGLYKGELSCSPLPAAVINPCPYTCAETAACSESKLVCACLKGYADASSRHGKPVGSICTKCVNSDHNGKDFVMLYDISNSISDSDALKMVKFVSDFVEFIDIENSDNRFSVIAFGNEAAVRFPLSPKKSVKEIIKIVSLGALTLTRGTRTARALQTANNEVYSKLPSDSTRPRVTILFTDGEPFCSYDDLKKEATRMRNTYKAQIITIYVGRKMDEASVKKMRAITSEDEELSVEHFEDLKETVLDRLQTKIC